MKKSHLAWLLPLLLTATTLHSQVLTLQQAVQTALNNYGSIKAKSSYLKASQSAAKATAVDYLPNLSLGAQQAYGSINGQSGPLLGSGGLGTASAGPPFDQQNWHSAFGSLYLININWDFFTFGKVRERNNLAHAEVERQSYDLEQEKFQHEVRVAAAYLNLLAAQRLRLSQQRNLERASALRTVVTTRAKNGLNPGVDSSLANAEVSSAQIALTNAIDVEAQQASQLSQLMGIPYQSFLLDTLFVFRIPDFFDENTAQAMDTHPLLKFYQSRIDVSRQQEKYYSRFKLPSFSLVGALQTRGSGFDYNYGEAHPGSFSHGYWEGIKPSRTNYIVGVGVSWNLTNIKRVSEQVASQQFTSQGLQNEFELVNQQIKAQLDLANVRIKNAVDNFHEAPIQMKAAADAYLQKSVLYKNGLATIVDITQALYTLNRAETDRDISINNIWQALLLKAAATGNFGLFINQFK